MKLPVMIFVVLCVTVLMALEDLGPLKTAQKKYPQIFQTGSVNIITINKIPCYVFSGNAEQAFSGEFAESESELYEEATLSARSNFYEFISEKDKNKTVSMTGCGVLYQYNDKKSYTVVLFVPKANVSVELNKTLPPPTKKDEPQLPEAEVTPKKTVTVTDNPPVSSTPSEKTVAPETKTEPQLSAPATNPPPVSSTPSEKTVVPDEALKQKLSSDERRIIKYRNRIANDPNDIISIIFLADLYKKTGDFSAALDFYLSAIKKIEQDKFFDMAEKVRLIQNVALLFEQINKYNMALKYYHYLLRHKCSSEQKKDAVAAISRLRLKTLD